MESWLVFSALLAVGALLFGLRGICQARAARRARLLRDHNLRLKHLHAMLDDIEAKISPR